MIAELLDLVAGALEDPVEAEVAELVAWMRDLEDDDLRSES